MPEVAVSPLSAKSVNPAPSGEHTGPLSQLEIDAAGVLPENVLSTEIVSIADTPASRSRDGVVSPTAHSSSPFSSSATGVDSAVVLSLLAAIRSATAELRRCRAHHPTLSVDLLCPHRAEIDTALEAMCDALGTAAGGRSRTSTQANLRRKQSEGIGAGESRRGLGLSTTTSSVDAHSHSHGAGAPHSHGPSATPHAHGAGASHAHGLASSPSHSHSHSDGGAPHSHGPGGGSGGSRAALTDGAGPGSPSCGGGVVVRQRVICARACVACGRDDRAGLQGADGFRCYECGGLPRDSSLRVQIELAQRVVRKKDAAGHKTINDYVVLGKLGAGSYAKVRMAVHSKSRQVYALKEFDRAKLRKTHKRGGTALDDVLREVTLMRTLQDPGLVTLYEIIDDPEAGVLILVLEYCARGTLFDISPATGAASRAVSVACVKRYTLGIARALHYLHSRGVVHRDIKPANILRDQYDNAKIADFGVSAATVFQSADVGAPEGSPAFMAPESLAVTDPTQGEPADIWAFGVSLWALVYGRLPFLGNGSRADLVRAICANDRKPAEHEDCALACLLEAMLATKPGDRITAAGIIEHAFVADVPVVDGHPVEPDGCEDDEEHHAHVLATGATEEARALAQIATREQSALQSSCAFPELCKDDHPKKAAAADAAAEDEAVPYDYS